MFERRTARVGERADEHFLIHQPRHLLADRGEPVEIGLLRTMRLHRVPLRVGEPAHIDACAKPLRGPALRPDRKGRLVRGEVRHELIEAVDEVGDDDHPVAALHMDVLAQLGPDPRDAGELDRPEGALPGGDVIGMAVPAVRSPDDHDVRPDLAQPRDDVPEHGLLGHAGKRPVGMTQAAHRRETEPPRALLELAFAGRPQLRPVHERGTGRTGLALLAASEAKAVTLHALARVSKEGATHTEGLIVRMREDRREARASRRRPRRHLADTSIRPVSGTRIVIVEDDPSVAELVTLYLKNAGFVVEHATTGAEAQVLFGRGDPALVILDLGLPDTDGLALFRALRRHSDAPVLALTARADDVQKIEGLDAGLDDYLTKPFNPKELVSRVQAILRRASGGGGGRPLTVGDLILDPARHEVHIAGALVTLRAKEFELLEAFCRQPGIVLTRDKLLENVWGFAYPGETRTVDVHVKQLRDKLAGGTARIETVWGVGYKLTGPPEPVP